MLLTGIEKNTPLLYVCGHNIIEQCKTEKLPAVLQCNGATKESAVSIIIMKKFYETSSTVLIRNSG